MNFFIIIISPAIIWLLYELSFYLTHKCPLTQEDIKTLAKIRRQRSIKDYYSFGETEGRVNQQFKSSIKPSGQLYGVNENLYSVPSLISTILKGKKHEWISIALEKEKKVNYLWFNKGNDNKSVSLLWNYEDIKDFASEKNITTVMHFHNHPNSNPNRYNCSIPSQADIKNAEVFSSIIIPAGFNLIEFVCERGRYYKYFERYTDSFMPVLSFINEIEQINNMDKRQNYKLHLELRKSKKYR